MGVDIWFYVEVYEDHKWKDVYQSPKVCNDCEESTKDNDDDDEYVCSCCDTKTRDAIHPYIDRDHALYSLFGYSSEILSQPYPNHRGFPKNSTFTENNSFSWSYITGQEFLNGPPCGWNAKLNFESPCQSRFGTGSVNVSINWFIIPYDYKQLKEMTCRRAFKPLEESGFANWIGELVSQHGGKNVRILWCFM